MEDVRAPRHVDGEIDLRSEPPSSVPSGSWFNRQLASPYVFLVPLRLFIGFGWLRASAEKLTDSSWYNGDALRAFLDGQLADSEIVFASYEWLISSAWDPIAMPLGWMVMTVQLVIGFAIFFGAFTNAALLAGILLNVNFMLAGAVSPSAFYIVIQVALLVMGVGAVFGFDGRLQNARLPIVMTAKAGGVASTRTDRRWVAGLATAFLMSGAMAITRATNFSPDGINDPALVLSAVMFVSALTLLLAVARDFALRDADAI